MKFNDKDIMYEIENYEKENLNSFNTMSKKENEKGNLNDYSKNNDIYVEKELYLKKNNDIDNYKNKNKNKIGKKIFNNLILLLKNFIKRIFICNKKINIFNNFNKDKNETKILKCNINKNLEEINNDNNNILISKKLRNL